LKKVCKKEKERLKKLYWCWNINQLPVRAKPLKVVKYLPKQIKNNGFNGYFKTVSAMRSGLTHPRRTKLQHGTFLHFGHPRL